MDRTHAKTHLRYALNEILWINRSTGTFDWRLKNLKYSEKMKNKKRATQNRMDELENDSHESEPNELELELEEQQLMNAKVSL